MEKMKLSVQNLKYSIDSVPILKGLNIEIPEGKITGLIGPNGCGKSTFLRNVYRALTPDSGTILLDGNDVHKLKYRDSARKMAVLRQESSSDFDYTVYEIASMERAPYHNTFDPYTDKDEHIIRESLEQVGLSSLSERKISTLSGGEKQRLFIARALIQQTGLLILDEPTNHLDIYHKIQIMELISKFDITVLSAIHDLELACKYCDNIIVLKNGEVFMQGTPDKVFIPEMFEKVFRVRVDLKISNERNLQIAYLGTV